MVISSQVNVVVGDAKVVDNSYVVYTTKVRVLGSSGSVAEYKSQRRFSEFLQLKQDLEREFQTEIPYEFPSREFSVWKFRSSSCDPDVIKARKEKLGIFLGDLLNDSFDVRWKRSAYLCKFLNMPNNWYNASRNHMSGAGDREEDCVVQLQDVSKWLESLRDSKSQFEEAKRNGNNITMMRIRLKLQQLEDALKIIEEKHLLGEGEVHRRWTILNALKSDLNKQSDKPQSRFSSYEDLDISHTGLKEPLVSNTREPHKPISGRRKLGETGDTVGLTNQQLLLLHKDTMKQQDQELEQLRNIVVRQKNLSLNMNQELAAQNEMLDMFVEDVNATSNKLRMANLSAKRFNDKR
ncbi:Vam7p Ecym_1203 [Eremothecium cymbalariae DBVPG|uniref:PX domain-containing protein n=1 Tax=Eremothecium cymbalariae (strain CBS 270.75 / DBVPG 7215 / KCTC 17166 / NRRL Y-17582) TaxID=931890 RepID=G8JMY7_ERECY|nr:hypothetical protein Ecym_1203 [Eremothecium cymbalariae DBVPG\